MGEVHAPGSAVRVVEVLHGDPWAWWDETVLADDGTTLVTVLDDGTAMSFPEHPFPHPWGHHAAWTGSTVLKLRRAGDWYSVWHFFEPDGRTRGWYVNLETPVVRARGAVEVNDLQLDVVIDPDGSWHWKDVHHLAPTLASGRISHDELLATLAAAAEIADLLERDERWWAPWDDWTPADGTLLP